jgi:cobalt/nickel transport system permease protein
MHIPDGYLSPQTYVPLSAAMVPVWAVASRKLEKTLRSRQAPFLAMGAAFSFVIMMFNIPIPGGTTGHAVGGSLIAILLGPWAACVAVSLALIIQALLFGDGGITAIAANCFSMAVVIPFVSFYSYRLISGTTAATSARRVVAAFVAGYLGLNAAALYTAILFGIQPLLATAPDGRPLYAPYPLSIAVPAMALEHLLFFGFIEALITALIIRYLQQTDPALLALYQTADTGNSPVTKRLWHGIGLLACLSPLGVVLPAAFKAEGAWGEWNAETLGKMLGFIPAGMERLATIWPAPLTGYTLPVGGVQDLAFSSLMYMLSATIGIMATIIGIQLLVKVLAQREQK